MDKKKTSIKTVTEKCNKLVELAMKVEESKCKRLHSTNKWIEHLLFRDFGC